MFGLKLVVFGSLVLAAGLIALVLSANAGTVPVLGLVALPAGCACAVWGLLHKER